MDTSFVAVAFHVWERIEILLVPACEGAAAAEQRTGNHLPHCLCEQKRAS
jgi:hypothetical protein